MSIELSEKEKKEKRILEIKNQRIFNGIHICSKCKAELNISTNVSNLKDSFLTSISCECGNVDNVSLGTIKSKCKEEKKDV